MAVDGSPYELTCTSRAIDGGVTHTFIRQGDDDDPVEISVFWVDGFPKRGAWARRSSGGSALFSAMTEQEIVSAMLDRAYGRGRWYHRDFSTPASAHLGGRGPKLVQQ